MNLHFEGYANENGKLTDSHELNGDKSHQKCNADLPAAKVPEMTKLNNLENASSQSLFSIVHKILDDSIEKKKDDVPERVVCLLKKLVLEIGQRMSRQAEDFKKQNNLCKSREKKYQSKIKVLETLATGATEENEVFMNQLRQIKAEKAKVEEKKRLEDEDLVRLRKEKNDCYLEIVNLKHELEVVKDTYKKQHMQLEVQAMEIQAELKKKIMELENSLTDSKKKVKELERFKDSRVLRWKKKEHGYKSFIDFQSGSLKELLAGCESIKQEVLKTRKIYSNEINHFGIKIHGLVDAAQNYHTVLAENRKLYNEVQDLKGNIRVYCRIRPFLKGQNKKQTTIEYIGENGELVVTNPYKQGKDGHRLFKFNKVFGPASTQEDVFLDTQPLIRSVLDGYNVCIFAYGQTGSGKTYTMTGPNVSCQEDWGVNYRALNDLFQLSQTRKSSFAYEIGVQMVEIYNEQVRDLLTSESTQKRLGIWNSTQPKGLAVPDASMHPVSSTADVLELMNIGLMNRAVGATALNERSSRSHSVLTVHVHGTDLKTNAVLRGNLHLVDLAGSERVDRSEATGDRLREAQHINKSLSALGDVIFALAQKSLHVPYRNSKLTQVLQSSLGGQAKTLMFVQLNPDVESFSETVSTLKFAERVSGVELGAARSNKEGRGVRELMEQMTSLKDTMAKKDEEIEQLRLLKTNTNVKNHIMGSPRRHSIAGFRHNHAQPGDKSLELSKKDSSDEIIVTVDDGQSLTINEDIEMLGVREADFEDRLSDISDGVLSMGTETDGSLSSIVEFTRFQDKPSIPTKIPRPPQKTSSSSLRQVRTTPARASLSNGFSRIFSGASAKKSTPCSSSSLNSGRRLV